MKKLLNTLYITDENSYLSLDGENIVVKYKDGSKENIPFSIFENIFCFNYIGCSPALMGKCVENSIPINFISPEGRFLARVTGQSHGNVYLRKAQIDLFGNAPIILAQNTVATKIANTRYIIKRTIKDYPTLNNDIKFTNCLNNLADGIESVYLQDNTEAILGIEGNCAKSYFEVFDSLILHQKEDFFLNSRTKRPPLDRVNAVLSYLYTIYTYDFASALESVGLDSYVGYYHTLRPGRCSLACDLVEETRCIVDRLVLTLINLKKLKSSDFETQVSGAVLLTKDGKKKVLTAWQEKKKRSTIIHPYLKQSIPLGLLPFVQSNLLAKYIRGEIEEYPCFLLKQVKEK